MASSSPSSIDPLEATNNSVDSEVSSNIRPRKKFVYIDKLQRRGLLRLKQQFRACPNIRKLKRFLYSGKFAKLEKFLSSSAFAILNSESVNRNIKTKKFSVREKILAISIYNRSPQCYRYLCTIFKLPSRVTIHKMLEKVPFDCGINARLINLIKKSATKMSLVNKLCVLSFGKIKLREGLISKINIENFKGLGLKGKCNCVANRAIVFMAQGIEKNWKQPIAYFFSKGPLHATHLSSLIKMIITSLLKAGLKVLATVCDTGRFNVKAINYLLKNTDGGESNKPVFRVEGRDIVALYDVPHLLKLTRNAIFKFEILCGKNNVAKHKYLKLAYEKDTELVEMSALRKIDPCFFKLKQKSKLNKRVTIATRLLCRTMACLIHRGMLYHLPEEAFGTAEFILKIDMLFDSLNTTARTNSEKKLKSRASLKSGHNKFWSEMEEYISSWKFMKDDILIKYSLQFQLAWVQTLKGMSIIINTCVKAGIKKVSTRNFNLDCLENLLDMIRQYGGFHVPPNPNQFTGYIKTAILNDLIVPNRKIQFFYNREIDSHVMLQNLRSFISDKKCVSKANK